METGSFLPMRRVRQFAGLTLAAAMTACAGRASAQDRSDENAITQAEDAFGFSVGRESLGIYNAGNARGFSPTAAGNVRIDGLYFDPIFGLSSTLVDSVSIKVGLSAQGYPFAAPSGIVDQTLRRPSAKNGASIVTNFDSFGSFGIEVDGTVVASDKLAVAYGATGGHVEFPDGTDNWNHGQSLLARWRPAPGIEIVPFWSLYNDYDDEAGTCYVPAGAFLPKFPRQRHYEGPGWSDFRLTGTNAGVLASAAISTNWLLRLGAFRSINNQKHAFTNLLVDEQPDGTGESLLFADPAAKSTSLSGELRLTHSIPDGPRLHVVHLSVRERDARREFGGSAFIDFGAGRIGEKVDSAEPQFDFDEVSHDHLKQTTYGIAYDGRWRNVGEISFGISRAWFNKATVVPDLPMAVSRSKPWLYNATAAANLTKTATVYAGYSRGLEESGVAPPNAGNRNEPLPAILTEQKDAGIRFALGPSIKAVAGVFDLSRPYFGFDAANVYTHVGSIRSRGAEFSLSGSLTPRVDVAAGGVFLKPKVTRDAAVEAVIGSRPVNLPTHLVSLNVNWRTPFVPGLELDVAAVQRGKAPATTDNLVFMPPRLRVDVGSHYRFKLANRNATLRLQVSNLFDKEGFALAGSGIYSPIAGRYVLGFLTIDV
jgi:iron complex outermembrane receptor protein